MKALNELRDGFCMHLGRGEVSLFFDKFMEDGAINQLLDFVHIYDTQLLVKDVSFKEVGISTC